MGLRWQPLLPFERQRYHLLICCCHSATVSRTPDQIRSEIYFKKIFIWAVKFWSEGRLVIRYALVLPNSHWSDNRWCYFFKEKKRYLFIIFSLFWGAGGTCRPLRGYIILDITLIKNKNDIEGSVVSVFNRMVWKTLRLKTTLRFSQQQLWPLLTRKNAS